MSTFARLVPILVVLTVACGPAAPPPAAPDNTAPAEGTGGDAYGGMGYGGADPYGGMGYGGMGYGGEPTVYDPPLNAYYIECPAYEVAAQAYIVCDKSDPASHEGVRAGIDAINEAAAQGESMPPEGQQALAEACRVAADAMRAMVSNLGCST